MNPGINVSTISIWIVSHNKICFLFLYNVKWLSDTVSSLKALEDFLGEYILNINPDQLRVQTFRGKVKLSKVQLDGNLIGSHIFNPVIGLSDFACLSCYAEKLCLAVPWTELEKKPTRIEVTGLYLICVPLLSTTAGTICGTGSARCTLRTCVKRSHLARLERNFLLLCSIVVVSANTLIISRDDSFIATKQQVVSSCRNKRSLRKNRNYLEW